MPDMPSLTARDYDPWQLATPQQLLTLCQRLGVNGIEIARWLRVPPSSVSMWLHGARAVPSKHIPALLERTRLAFDQAVELNDKAVALAQTEALRQSLRAEFAAVWTAWKTAVLRDAGTFKRALQQDCETLATLARKDHFTAEDRETMSLVMQTMLAKVDLVMQNQREVPSAEAELIARLTQAHEANAAAARRPHADDDGSTQQCPSVS